MLSKVMLAARFKSAVRTNEIFIKYSNPQISKAGKQGTAVN
jgi:hypothetical protein